MYVTNYSQACRAIDATARRLGYSKFDGNHPAPPTLSLDGRLEADDLFLAAGLSGLDAGGWRDAIAARCRSIVATAALSPTGGPSR